jgi:hypothetical protein
VSTRPSVINLIFHNVMRGLQRTLNRRGPSASSAAGLVRISLGEFDVRKLFVFLLAGVTFAGCADTASIPDSMPDAAQAPLAPEESAILNKVAGKTYQLRGSPSQGGMVGLHDERRISFGLSRTARFYFTNHHGYYLSPCTGWSPVGVMVVGDKIKVEGELKNLPLCRESWSFEVVSDGTKLFTANGIVFTQQ